MWVNGVTLVLLAAISGTAANLDIYSLHVRSDIQLRFATTLITSRVANLAEYSNEVVFRVTLPDEAFISNFTMEIDGVVYPGVVDEKEAAKKKFEKAKKKGKSTGLVSNEPRDIKKFKVQVNVAAMSKVTFNLTYQELLKRTLGAYQHKIYINPGQPVRDLQISVAIQESRDITMLHIPPIQTNVNAHRNEYSTVLNRFAAITRPSKKSAFVTYSPTVDQQKAASAAGLAGNFIVEYDIERSLDAGDVLVVNGYFVHFLSPAIHQPVLNDVLFILDMSGSMYGNKLKQLKEAMIEILSDLKEGDRFNILEFTHGTKLYRDEMIDVTAKNIFRAKQYVNRLKASGSTNINEALLRGVKLLKSTLEGRPPLVMFLTDGLPSAGVTRLDSILQNVMEANGGEVPIFSLAFGSGADWKLVKKVAIQNDGFGRKIYEDSDAALQITGFYDEVAVTLLNNVTVDYLGDTVDKDSLTRSSFKNFFNGSEMVVAGRLQDPNTRSLDVEVFGDGAEGSLVLTMKKEDGELDLDSVTNLMEISDIGTIAEKLWAYMTIKQLLKDVDRDFNKTAQAIYKERALELSMKYGFVTPLTSLVVTRPQDEDEEEEDEVRPTTTPKPTTPRPHRYYSGGGYGGGGGGDPHYMIRIKGIEHPICFDVGSKAGEIHNIITDPAHDITINTLIIPAVTLNKKGEEKTFIGQVSVQLAHHVIIVTHDAVFYDTKVFEWIEERSKHFGGSQLTFTSAHTLSIRLSFGPEIIIKRSAHHDPDTGKVDFLNVYVKDEDYFSKHTSGLIGQFVNGHKHIIMKKNQTQPGGKLIGKFQVKERPSNSTGEPKPTPIRHAIRGTLTSRSEVVDKGTELCWMVHEKFEKLLVGEREHFLVDDFIKQDI